jgi:hypothetical protein
VDLCQILVFLKAWNWRMGNGDHIVFGKFDWVTKEH